MPLLMGRDGSQPASTNAPQGNRRSGQHSAEWPVRPEYIVGTIAGALLSSTQSVLAGAVVMLILLYFLLASGDLFLRKLVRVLPKLSDKKRAIEIARQTERHVSTYLATVTLINMGLGLAVALAMKLVGMPNPVLWGVTAGLLNYIPYLGPIVTAGVLTLVAVLSFDELGRALIVPALYMVINGLEGYLVTPTLLGRRLTLNPVVIFTGLIFWGWLWGIPGALLAVPILATFKIFCDHIPPLAPIPPASPLKQVKRRAPETPMNSSSGAVTCRS